MDNKIYDIKNLAKILLKKRIGKKVILCHGVFDLLHIGHINHFESSKKKGEILVISVTPDRYVNKGPNRPAFSENLRLKALASLEIVDYVVLNNSANAISAIKYIKPDYYSKGKDYKNTNDDLTGKINEESRLVKKLGGKFLITENQLYSSSKIINNFLSHISEEQKRYILNLKSRFKFEEIKKKINDFSNLKVLVIGETILDEYIFCEPLGKSGKEAVLSFKKLKKKKYLGGALAIARNLSSFCKKASVLTFLGDQNEELEFIKQNIEKNIKFYHLKKKSSKTIIKTRYVDSVDNRKLIGIYTVDDRNISLTEENKFIQKIHKVKNNYDLIIISDYGHGIFTDKVVKYISKINKYKSLNAQINSTNMGFHNIRRYKNIDNIVINATELRHEMRDREGDLKSLGKKLMKHLKSKSITTTEGRAGALFMDNNNIFRCPAFGFSNVDKIGAGDTMLAVLSLCLYSKIDKKLSMLVASLAAAENIKNYGNSKTIDKNIILKTIYHLTK